MVFFKRSCCIATSFIIQSWNLYDFTKQFFEDNQVPFVIKDVFESEEALEEVKALGFQSLPVVVADGIEPFFGFRPDILEQLVG